MIIKNDKFLISVFLFLCLCGGFLFWFHGYNFYQSEILKGSNPKDIDTAFINSNIYPIRYNILWSIMNCFFVLSIVPLLLIMNIPSFTDIYIMIKKQLINCR